MFTTAPVVEYIEHMGNDLSVVNAARVSFEKESLEFSDSDERLIKYLARHGHWSPFAHAVVKFRITCPLFVAAQLHKHQVGMNVNSVSRRYVSDVTVWRPDAWRWKVKNKKQGSGGNVDIHTQRVMDVRYESAIWKSIEEYNNLLALGACEEQARAVLPTATNTTFIWTGTLAAWLRVIDQRCSEDSQYETREVAERIKQEVERLFPASTNAWITRDE